MQIQCQKHPCGTPPLKSFGPDTECVAQFVATEKQSRRMEVLFGFHQCDNLMNPGNINPDDRQTDNAHNSKECVDASMQDQRQRSCKGGYRCLVQGIWGVGMEGGRSSLILSNWPVQW